MHPTTLRRTSLVLFSWAGLGLAFSSGAHAGNIVQDGGFELADPSGVPGGTDYFSSGSSIDGGFWNVTQGVVGVDTQNFFVFDGNKSIFLSPGSTSGGAGGPDSLTQTLVTTPGQVYTISFWANADVENTFSATFGGVAVSGAPSIINLNGFPSNVWLGNSGEFTFYSGTAMATGASTDLTLTATGIPGGTGVTVEIDDVSVTSSIIPEPSSAVLAAIGAIGGLVMLARNRKVSPPR
jgi:hypothetical protein